MMMIIPSAYRRRCAQIRHVLLFFVAPILSSIVPLAVIPAVSARFGSDGWASIAIALGVGNAGLIVAELGWGIIGPQQVARNPGRRQAIYEEALASKLVVTLGVAVLSGILAGALSPAHSLAAGLVASGSTLAALSSSWYFVGIGRPGLVLASETVPRVLLVGLAATLIFLGADLVVYGVVLIVSSTCTLVLAAHLGNLSVFPSLVRFRAVPQTIRAQASLVMGRGVSTLYTSLPAAFLGMVSPASVATFSAVDRPMRMGFVVLGAIPARLQSWVGTPDVELARRRSRVSILLNAGLGAGAGLVFVVAMPAVLPVLFVGVVKASVTAVFLGGLTVFAMCSSRGLVMALVAAGRAHMIALANVVAALCGVPAILLGGHYLGTEGALGGVLIAEVAGILAQVIILLRSGRETRPGTIAGQGPENQR